MPSRLASDRATRLTLTPRPWFSLPGLALLLSLLAACKPEPALPVLFQVPDFSLVDQAGQPFGTAELGGRPAVVDFVYTTCTDTCPLLSQTMAQLQEHLRAEGLLGGQVILLSITVDPERDTPPVLARYGERFAADAAGWKLLSGDPEATWSAIEGFKVGRPFPLPLDARNPVVNLAHTNRFMLMDGSGQVRATYLYESLVISDVVHDVKRLLR
jgi:protein SCO1/2